MNLPTTIHQIQTYLQDQTVTRFADLLAKAQNTQNYTLAQNLVAAAETLLPDNPTLQRWHTYALGYLAITLRGSAQEAISHFESLRGEKDNLPPDLLKRVLMGLGVVYEMNEQWDRAMRVYHRYLDHCQSDGDDLGQGKALTNLAILHHKGSDYPLAASCAKESISLLQQNPEDAAWQLPLGRAWNELGMADKQLGRLSEATAAFEQYLSICARWDYEAGRGIAHNNLADVHRRLGNIQQARRHYRQAREISEKAGNLFEAAEAIFGLGLTCWQDKKSPDKAESLFEEALAAAQSANNHEITTQIHLSRADLAEQAGDAATALSETRQAVQTVESLRANIVLPEARIRLQGSRIEAYEQMVSRLCQSPSGYAEAFHYAEMAKSRALIEMLAGRPIRQPENVPANWLQKEAQLKESLQSLYRKPDGQAAQIATLEAELGQLRQRIRLQNAEFQSFQTVAPLSLETVMARLPVGGVLLEYFTVGDAIWAFVVTATDIKATRLPLRVQDLQRVFVRTGNNKRQLRHLHRGRDHRLHQPWVLNKLAQTLLDPLGEAVWTAPLLCIVPHGLLHYIPFHALYRQTKTGPTYLFEAGGQPRQIIYAPSAAALLDYCQQKPPSTQTGCLALGFNDHDLTQAELEAQRIAQMMKGQSRTGAAAARSALLAEGANYRYIHLSCHGWFNSAWPMASALSLSDALLDASDVLQNLRLDAELVALSACETGRSRILQGDELVGLTRAFLYAGTPSVLVSHWLVDELSTRLLMEQFYKTLKRLPQTEAGAKATALSQAQRFIKNLTFDELKKLLIAEDGSAANVDRQLRHLAVWAGYDSLEGLNGDECLLAHPYYWAPFFLVGDRLVECTSSVK